MSANEYIVINGKRYAAIVPVSYKADNTPNLDSAGNPAVNISGEVTTRQAISSTVESRFAILNDKGDDSVGGMILGTGNAGISAATSGSGTPFNFSSFSNSPTKGRIILHQPTMQISPINYLMVTINAGTISAAATILSYNEGTDDGIIGGESRGVTYDSDSEFQLISAQRPVLEIDFGSTLITDVYILPLWTEGTPAGAAAVTGEFWA